MNSAAPEPKANMGEPGRASRPSQGHRRSPLCLGFPVSNPAFAYLVTSSIAKGSIGAWICGSQSRARRARDFHAREHRRAEKGQVRRRRGGPHVDPGLRSENPARRPDRRDGGGGHLRGCARGRPQGARDYKAEEPSATFDRRASPKRMPARPSKLPRTCRRPAMRGPPSTPPRSNSRASTAHRPNITTPSSCSPPLRVARRRVDGLRAEPVHVRVQERPCRQTRHRTGRCMS